MLFAPPVVLKWSARGEESPISTASQRNHSSGRRLRCMSEVGLNIATRLTFWALLPATLFVLVLGLAKYFDPLPEGLRGSYVTSHGSSSAEVFETTGVTPSTQNILSAWGDDPPETFSAMWTGSIVTLADGMYTLATDSDDGSAVRVDGQSVVDNGGRHGKHRATGTIHMARGTHTIVVEYFQAGGSLYLDLLWGRDGGPLETVPRWALTPKRPSFPRFVVSVTLRRSLFAAQWLWIAALLLVAGSMAGPRLTALRSILRSHPAWRLLGAVVAASLVLNLAGIWWGLPGASWAPDELTPDVVMGAVSQHFSNGWWDRYPPFQYYVLATAINPLVLLQKFGAIDLSSELWWATALVVSRLVTVAAGAGTLVALYLCAARVFSMRAGVFAAAAFALVAPFVYYSKTANLDIPYLFWFALSLVFYLRLLDGGTRRDAACFAITATLAICTKDQAYGLYLAVPGVVVWEMWRANRGARLTHPIARAFADGRLWIAAVCSALVFVVCHNLLLNLAGFLQHVRYITGFGSEGYRAFEHTWLGHWQLVELTAELDRISMGWPLVVISSVGLIGALAKQKTRRAAIWLAIPAVSYYLGFINVVLYNYDRFLLPVCLLQALFAGAAVDHFLGASRRPHIWRTAAVGALFAYTLLYAGTVDLLMLRDSRYQVEQWMGRHAKRDERVGTMFPDSVLPRLGNCQVIKIRSIDDLERENPAFYVLNADYARAVPSGAPDGQLVAALQRGAVGYTRVLQSRSPDPWPWLPGAHPDLVGPRLGAAVVSVLRDINPTIQVYRRRFPPPESPSAAAPNQTRSVQ